jgi:hypothetical protein
MTQWEYMVISTSIEADDSPDSALDATFDKVIAEIQDAGAQGWEAVGGVDFRLRPRRGANAASLTFPALLFKRPQPADAPPADA